MVNDETFFAWLDGELEAAEAARVEAEVAADPRLSTMAAEHRTMQARLKGAFDTIIDAPMPGHLAAAARTPPQAEVIDFAEARKKSDRAWPSPGQWSAMAATLAIGVLIGTLAPQARQASPVDHRPRAMTPQGVRQGRLRAWRLRRSTGKAHTPGRHDSLHDHKSRDRLAAREPPLR